VKAFQEELTHLINRHSIENVADMPDFILADMICRMIEAIGPKVKHTLDWHGCSSVCHPKPITPDCQLGKECPTPMRECPECAKEYLAAKSAKLNGVKNGWYAGHGGKALVQDGIIVAINPSIPEADKGILGKPIDLSAGSCWQYIDEESEVKP
jgi:hypothetical protein